MFHPGAQDTDGKDTGPSQHGLNFMQEKHPQSTNSETNKDLLQDSPNYVSDILKLGLCTNCNDNYFNCKCSQDIFCKKCYVKKMTCNCIKRCKECKGFIFPANTEIIESLQCLCDKNFIHALKTKLELKHNLEEKQPNDCILEEDQSNVSGDIEQKLDRFNIAPPEPGQTVNLSHVSDDIKCRTEKLLNSYDASFASHRYDTGTFSGFTANIEVEPGSTVIEKERPMRANVRHELRPMIEDLLREGIIKHADYSGPFLSNGHGVPKPDKNISVAGKADLYLLKQSGVSTNHARLTIDMKNLNKHVLKFAKS